MPHWPSPMYATPGDGSGGHGSQVPQPVGEATKRSLGRHWAEVLHGRQVVALALM